MAIIKSIGDLIIPPTLSGNAEPFNADNTRRTVNMRLIKKLSPKIKWRVTLNYEGRALSPEFQHALYAKINSMRNAPEVVIFVNPDTGETVNAKMLRISRQSPIIAMHDRGVPKYYTGVGAVFEEI